MEVVRCVSEVLKNLRNPSRLRGIFNDCVVLFAKSEEKIFFEVALVSYLLSKVVQKPRFKKNLDFITKKSAENFRNAINFLKKGDKELACKEIEKIIDVLRSVDERDSRYVFDIAEKGKTKIASILYAEGFSLERSINLTGADRAEVLKYSGQTRFADRFGKTISEAERLEIARKILKKK